MKKTTIFLSLLTLVFAFTTIALYIFNNQKATKIQEKNTIINNYDLAIKSILKSDTISFNNLKNDLQKTFTIDTAVYKDSDYTYLLHSKNNVVTHFNGFTEIVIQTDDNNIIKSIGIYKP